MHKKRSELPTSWPLPRKGTKYFVVGTHATTNGIPLIIAFRDILGIVKTNRELRVMLQNKDIFVNQKVRTNEKFPIRAFDILTYGKVKKNLRLVIVGKKMKFEEIKENEANEKTVRIIGKVILSKDKIQMNLEDGTNLLVKEKFSLGDSAVIDLKEIKLKTILPMKEGAKVFVVSGKHAGNEGKVKEIILQNGKKEYLIKLKDSEAKLLIKTLLVVN